MKRFIATALATCALGCAADPASVRMRDADENPDQPIVPVGPSMAGLHVVGNHIENAEGAVVVLRGTNRSGTEYRCVQNGGLFDGPATYASIRAMAAWKINAVRIPLNESCWLNINGVPTAYSGQSYKNAIQIYVNKLRQYNIVPIVELHWVGPGTAPADRQQPMPDADHAVDFWSDVAATFAADDDVVLELYNEPFPDGNRNSNAAWQCWKDGCMARQAVPAGGTATMYQAVGLQTLVSAVRAAGANNLILLGGVQYSNALSQWMAYAPVDPAGNLAAAWHSYNFNACNSAAGCWDTTLATLMASVPLVATEFGQNDCSDTYIGPLLDWLDAHGAGYLAWSWNAYGPCQPAIMNRGGQPWSLITDFSSGRPNSTYAQAFHDHLQGL